MGNSICFASRCLALTRIGNLRPHPIAVHAVLGEDEQQLVMQPDGLIELLMNLAPALDVVRRKPAAHAFVLQIGIEPLGKLLVFGRIADEAGVELDRPPPWIRCRR